MTPQEIRLECYREAVIASRSRPGTPPGESFVASLFLAFCDGSELRLKALKIGLELSGRSSPLETAMVMATELAEFAAPPLVETPANPRGRKRKKR